MKFSKYIKEAGAKGTKWKKMKVKDSLLDRIEKQYFIWMDRLGEDHKKFIRKMKDITTDLYERKKVEELVAWHKIFKADHQKEMAKIVGQHLSDLEEWE